ncbi:MAG: hypothetical protein WBN40_09155 [Pseudomonadales bacterium]
MKKLTALTAAVAMASAMQASAEFNASAYAHVYVNIVPNISIGGVGSSAPCYDCNGSYEPTTEGSTSYSGGSSAPNDYPGPNGETGSTAGLSFVDNVFLGDRMTGYILGTVDFYVHANSQQIELACAATDLFKGNVPVYNSDGSGFENEHDGPIPLYQGYGCDIDLEYGNPLAGGSNNARFGSKTTMDAGWKFYETNSITFENNHPEPTQNISLTVKWNQNDHEKRQGQYSGFVKLIAMIPGY